MNNISSPRTDDAGIEQEIQAKGLTAPRVTPADIEANIASQPFLSTKTQKVNRSSESRSLFVVS